MKRIIISFGLSLLGFVPACASTAAPTGAASPEAVASEAPAPPGAAPEAARPSTQPDPEKARAHLQKHVKYPADRHAILAACADTPEFSEAEKRWFEEHLPEGSYESAEQTISALSL